MSLLQLVCSNCKVNRKITLEATPISVQQKTLCFCALCVTIARNTSARTIAARELLEKDSSRLVAASFRSTNSHSSGGTRMCVLGIKSPVSYINAHMCLLCIFITGSADSPHSDVMTTSFKSVARKAHVLWQPEAGA